MYLSKRSNGVYYVFYPQGSGKKTCISTKTKFKSEALKFLSRFESELDQRKNQAPVQVSLNSYCDNFLVHSQNYHTILTQKCYRLSLGYLKAFLGDISLNEITPSRISEYFEKRLKVSSFYQARKDLIVLNSFFNKAVDEGHLNLNPCKNIKRFKIPQKQPLFFSQSEFDKLIKEIKENDLRDIVLFAVQTGLRQMELITLHWAQINLSEKFIILDNLQHITKSKKIRTIPLTQIAAEILLRREGNKFRNINPEVVFTYNFRSFTQSTLTHKFKEYIRSSKINPNLTFHSLRHTFASWLVQRGVSIYEVSKLLGHSSINVTEIYSHLRAEDLRSAVNKLNN